MTEGEPENIQLDNIWLHWLKCDILRWFQRSPDPIITWASLRWETGSVSWERMSSSTSRGMADRSRRTPPSSWLLTPSSAGPIPDWHHAHDAVVVDDCPLDTFLTATRILENVQVLTTRNATSWRCAGGQSGLSLAQPGTTSVRVTFLLTHIA